MLCGRKAFILFSAQDGSSSLERNVAAVQYNDSGEMERSEREKINIERQWK